MIPVGSEYANPRTGARMVITENSGDRVVVERLMRPQTGRVNSHVHLDFEQWFEVVSGVGTIRVDGEKRLVEAGERVHIPVGVRHVDLYNDHDEDLLTVNEISPAPYFVQVFIATLGEYMERDQLNEQGEFSELQLFAVLRACRAQSFRAGPPVPLQKAVIALGAVLGRARGHQPVRP